MRLVIFFLIYAAMGFTGYRYYSAETLIASESSAINGVVRVLEGRDGVRRMRFVDSSVQSAYDTKEPGRVVTPYIRSMLAGYNFLPFPPRRVLVIGMGGGSLGWATRNQFPDAWIDLVDIDPIVVGMARRHMGFVGDAKMRGHIADGRAFIERVTEPYDLIYLDAYNGTDAPRHLITREFHDAVMRALRPGGVVVMNILHGEFNPAFASMVRTHAAVYPAVRVYTVPGGRYNRVVVAAAVLPEKISAADLGDLERVDLAQGVVFRDLPLQTAEGVTVALERWWWRGLNPGAVGAF